jgi:hypothetical protein
VVWARRLSHPGGRDVRRREVAHRNRRRQSSPSFSKNSGSKAMTPSRSAPRPTMRSQQGRRRSAIIGVLCGGFTEDLLRQAGGVEIYPGPATLFTRFANSLLAR